MSTPARIRIPMVAPAGERLPLFEVLAPNGTSILRIPVGSSMVVADGWRGAALHVVARCLYGPRSRSLKTRLFSQENGAT